MKPVDPQKYPPPELIHPFFQGQLTTEASDGVSGCEPQGEIPPKTVDKEPASSVNGNDDDANINEMMTLMV